MIFPEPSNETYDGILLTVSNDWSQYLLFLLLFFLQKISRAVLQEL